MGNGITVSIDGVTIRDGNAAAGGAGGGIIIRNGTLTVTNSTITGNTVDNNDGGGIRVVNAGAVTLKNTIVANSTGGNCSNAASTLTVTADNMADDATCDSATQKTLVQINLGALTGSPQYFPLNTGSAAIDAGDNAICAAAPVSNASQNGIARPSDGDGNGTATCDIGSYEAPDTTPDAFSFTAQTGVALSTVTASNTITVAGINSASAISIVGGGGTYKINAGAYTAVASTVNNGDTVTLKQTSSGGFSMLTTATLTIGGVAGAFNVTTLAAPAVTTYTAASATGTGAITASFIGGGAGCGYTVSNFIPVTGGAGSPPAGTAPAGVSFPQGLFDFTTGGCAAGSTLTFIVTYPQALPPGTVYWKYGPAPGNAVPHWYVLPAAIAANTATFTITDGGLGDDDLMANGAIVDQGGPGVGGAAGIPTLSEWGMILLSGLIMLFGLAHVRRRGTVTST